MEGSRLRALRVRFGLTQQQVAVVAGMRQPDLSAIERGRRGTAESRERVLAALRSLARPSQALDPKAREDLRATLRRYGAKDVRIFGSVARGDDRPGSDLDLMARLPGGFDLFDLMRLEEELEDLLGVRVDLVSDSPRTRLAMTGARAEAVAL